MKAHSTEGESEAMQIGRDDYKQTLGEKGAVIPATISTQKTLRVLVACERSGRVRDELTALGHDATSCDMLPSRTPGKHILCDHTIHLADVVYDRPWDLLIAFPPCTYINSAGLHWNNRGRGHNRTDEALEFVCMLMNAPIPHVGLENPIGCITTRLGQLVTGGKWVVKPNTRKRTCPPSQIIQPYRFGDDASKATCLWLKNLPLLEPTCYVEPRFVNGKPRWSNQTDSGQNRLGPSEDRGAIRAVTYLGIAAAMANQWGAFCVSQEENQRASLIPPNPTPFPQGSEGAAQWLEGWTKERDGK